MHTTGILPSTITLNDRLYNDFTFMITHTGKIPKKETGGYLIRNLAGKLGIIAVTSGETKEIHIEKTEGMNEGEKYIGTVHVHTHRPYPSIHDIGTFLQGKEQVMVVGSYDGSANVLIKIPETRPVDDVEALKQQYDNATADRAEIADTYVYAHYFGNLNEGKDLSLINGNLKTEQRSVLLDELTSDVLGQNELPDEPVKK